jgi:LysM repeat protein
MSSIRVVYSGSSSASALVSAQRFRSASFRQPRVSLRGEAGTTLTLPLLPATMEHSGFGKKYDTFDRIGLKPILSPSSLGLRVYSFSLIVVARDPDTGDITNLRSIEGDLQTLIKMSETGERLHWTNLGPIEKGYFRMTSLSFSYAQRVFGTRRVSVAEASVELTEASDVKIQVGPVSGGASVPVPRAPTQSGSGTPTPATAGSYTVRSGDTLSAIALRELGRASRYPEIADLNKITNPNRIQPGQVLRIPAS